MFFSSKIHILSSGAQLCMLFFLLFSSTSLRKFFSWKKLDSIHFDFPPPSFFITPEVYAWNRNVIERCFTAHFFIYSEDVFFFHLFFLLCVFFFDFFPTIFRFLLDCFFSFQNLLVNASRARITCFFPSQQRGLLFS